MEFQFPWLTAIIVLPLIASAAIPFIPDKDGKTVRWCMAQHMPKTFAMFTAGAMASLALPGMSGFVGELSVFLGIATSDVYGQAFKTGIVFLTAVGLILTPIYLLSMLREVFYGDRNPVLKLEDWGLDAQPREIFIPTCLLLPIVGIGLYPKLITDSYDIKTIEVASKARSALPVIVRQQIDAEDSNYGFISSLPSSVLAEVKTAP